MELADTVSQSSMTRNLVVFARALREAGIPVGPDRVLQAAQAVSLLDLRQRDDFFAALMATLIDRAEHRELFREAFHLYWRNPRLLERLLGAMLPAMQVEDSAQHKAMSRRLQEALAPRALQEQQQIDLRSDASLSFSSSEILQQKDFESMSASEAREAKLAIAQLRAHWPHLTTRRFRRSPAHGRLDMRATLQRAARSAGGLELRYRKPGTRPPAIVLICDISGSMSVYSRMFLHFMHTLSNDQDRVYSFLFGTRLSNVSRLLRDRDVDQALDKISLRVQDWSGGTRIGECLQQFNRHWARRVLSQGSVVVLVSDGLERDSSVDLGFETDRLARSCRRLVWLNPLLRYEQFEPRAAGIRAMLPRVHDFRSVHNLDSLAKLAGTLEAAFR